MQLGAGCALANAKPLHVVVHLTAATHWWHSMVPHWQVRSRAMHDACAVRSRAARERHTES